MDLYNIYIEGRSDWVQTVEYFEKKYHTRIIKQLKKEKSRKHFLSKIAELQFGLFFDKLASSLKYNQYFHGKKPDWIIQMNDQTIIMEVVRLGPSDSDQKKLDFEDSIFEAFQSIKIGCELHFNYNEHELDKNKVDIQVCRDNLELWLAGYRNLGDTIVLDNAIEVEFIEYNANTDHAYLYGGGGMINYDYRRLNSPGSRLVEKAVTYSDLIVKTNYPYIIGFYMDNYSWFREDDLYQSLYGDSVEDLDHGSRYQSLEKALFYCNDDFKNVSGVLLQQSNEFRYYHNYIYKNKLNHQNIATLLKWQCSVD